MVSCEVVDLLCNRLRSLPYRYIYRIKTQVLLICNSRKVAKTELYISAIKKGRQGSGKAESGEDISDKRYVRVGVGCVLQSIIRNPSGYIAISIELNRKTSFCVIA